MKTSNATCLKQLQVNKTIFIRLCYILEIHGELVATRNVTFEEIVTLFFHILGHNKSMCIEYITEFFFMYFQFFCFSRNIAEFL